MVTRDRLRRPPNSSVVLIDDRSTDTTSQVADTIAASDPRVHVEHVCELPDGWLGKVHALARGADSATASSSIALGQGSVELDFYPSLHALMVGIEKNGLPRSAASTMPAPW